MRKIWLISDTHFGHDKMIQYCDRPENFNEKLWAGLKMIQPEDTLIHLGDICIGHDEEHHRHLMGIVQAKKILVLGNHDHKSDNWYLNHGWDFVCKEFSGKYFGKRVLFSHEPVADYDTSKYDVNIHGHMHNNDHRGDTEDFIWGGRAYRLVAVEYTDYKPIQLKTIL